MRIYVSTFGTDVKLREAVVLTPASPSVRDVLSALREHYRAPVERFLNDDLSPREGAAVLVNGRNILSLDQFATTIREGDELTFTVMVAGG
jgi:molybdopterin converting factor small subunit